MEAVQTMARIAARAETALEYESNLEVIAAPPEPSVTDASLATRHAAQELKAKATLRHCRALQPAMLKYKPKARIRL